MLIRTHTYSTAPAASFKTNVYIEIITYVAPILSSKIYTYIRTTS